MAVYQRHELTLPSPSEPFRQVYHEWLPDIRGSKELNTVFCVHGLTRNARDFDVLAKALTDRGHRVICPDIAGRGESGWLHNPVEYNNPNYAQHMAGLILTLGISQLDWVGTSMGGLIGMGLASVPNSAINRLVINDVGPLIPAAALSRIGEYVGRKPVFASLEEVEAYLRKVHAPFGPLTDAQWQHLAKYGARLEGGQYRLAYDPNITDAFVEPIIEDIVLWPVWDAIKAKTLVIRGAESDLLPAVVAQEMARRGPKTRVAEIAGCGHAPALMARDQVMLVCDWLDP